jgi:hypothetical protein
MAKRETSKAEAKAARVNSREPKAEPFPEARPMQEDEIEDLLGALFERAGSDPEDENGKIDALLARQGLERICLIIAAQAMRWAREDGESGRSAWAGRCLADLWAMIEKRRAWLAENSEAFKKRRASLSALSNLDEKPSTEEPLPYREYMKCVYARVVEVSDSLPLLEAFQEEGLMSFEKIARRFPHSAFEAGIPELIEEAERIEDSTVRARFLFDEVIWPLLNEWRAAIEADPWCEKEIAKRGSRDQRSANFGNLHDGFWKAWLTLYSRPKGPLRGIERASL